MKKLILIIFLFATTANAQWLPFDWFTKSKTAQVTYTARANDFFARATNLTTSQKAIYNTLFQQLQDSGIIGSTRTGDSLQFLRIYAKRLAGADTNTLKNLLDTSNTASIVNSPVFTDTCISGGTLATGYLNSNFNPVVDSTRFKMNSNIIGVYSLTTSPGVTFLNYIGSIRETPYGLHCILARSSGYSYFYPLVSADKIFATTNTGGSFTAIRRTSTVIDFNIRGFDVGGFASSPSVAFVNLKMFVLAVNSNGTVAYGGQHCIVADWAGLGLSADKLRKLNNIINTCLTSLNIKTY